MAELMNASHQWATRPADERFTNLVDLHNAVSNQRQHSAEKQVSSRVLRAVPVGNDHKGLQLIGQNGNAVDISHHAFNQLSTLSGAPAAYLRKLPAELAADNLNFGLQVTRELQDVGLLLTRGGNNLDKINLRAATGPRYGRVWNSQITGALIDRFGDGVNGTFKVPGEFGKDVEVTKDNTTLFAGDRDMFVFLADEKNRIEIPNRRDGQSGQLARGFFVWNSEVGAATFGVMSFLFDYVCCNRIVWGAQEVKEIRIRHTATAPDKWIEEVAPALENYANSSTASITQAIANSRKSKVEKVDEFLKSRSFNTRQIEAIKLAHDLDEGRPMESLWDLSTGITAYARGIQWQDERVAVEREAGLILDMAQ